MIEDNRYYCDTCGNVAEYGTDDGHHFCKTCMCEWLYERALYEDDMISRLIRQGMIEPLPEENVSEEDAKGWFGK